LDIVPEKFIYYGVTLCYYLLIRIILKKRLISKVVHVVDQGGLIVYPTDTFYGIGCDLFNKKIYQKKYTSLKEGL